MVKGKNEITKGQEPKAKPNDRYQERKYLKEPKVQK